MDLEGFYYLLVEVMPERLAWLIGYPQVTYPWFLACLIGAYGAARLTRRKLAHASRWARTAGELTALVGAFFVIAIASSWLLQSVGAIEIYMGEMP